MFESIKPIKSLCCPHGTVTESSFEHFMFFWCSFSKFDVELNAKALFLQISH
jgi:hypothetical protein